jgi:hypothetical protein
MNRTQGTSLIAAAMLLLLPASSRVNAHSWYGGAKDPVSGYQCCGGSDCAAIPASWVRYERDGFRLTLTIGQARAVNPHATKPIDAFIAPARVQPSPDMNFHVCLYAADRREPNSGVICFFAPMVSWQ